MHSDITVILTGGREIHLAVPPSQLMSFGAARDWLDEQFAFHHCEPLRESGKVLLADKVLAVAAAMNAAGFDDAQHASAFARAAVAALGKSSIQVDVPRMSVTC